MKLPAFALVIMGLSCPLAALGQNATVRYHVVPSDNGLRLAAPETGTLVTAPTVASGQALEITLICLHGVDCQGIHVITDAAIGQRYAAASEAADQARIVVPDDAIRDDRATSITLRKGNVSLLPALAAAPAARGAQPRETGSWAELLSTVCPEVRPTPTYDRSANVGRFLVTPTGNVLARPDMPLDEDDRVEVTIIATQEIINRLKVERVSAFREVGQVRYIGADVELPDQLDVQSTADCTHQTYELSDFASGRGEIGISVLSDNGDSKRVGGFDFGVNPLYSGAFTFGPLLTSLDRVRYGVSDSTVFEAARDDTRGEYMIAYTHFIWGRRDVEKPLDVRLWRLVNPTIGLMLDDPLSNVLAGGSVDLFDGSVYLTAGWHGGEETQPAAGLEPGDSFDGDDDDLPLREDFTWKPFYAVTVDLRAAVQLLGKLGGT